MTNISIHLTESEYNLVRQHIENKGLTISQYIKVMLLEEIEDEYDVSIVNEYIQEKDTMAFLSFEDATKERIIQHFVFLAAIDPRNPLVLESDIRHS